MACTPQNSSLFHDLYRAFSSKWTYATTCKWNVQQRGSKWPMRLIVSILIWRPSQTVPEAIFTLQICYSYQYSVGSKATPLISQMVISWIGKSLYSKSCTTRTFLFPSSQLNFHVLFSCCFNLHTWNGCLLIILVI